MKISAGYNRNVNVLHCIVDVCQHDVPGEHSETINKAAAVAVHDAMVAQCVFNDGSMAVKFDGLFVYGVFTPDDEMTVVSRTGYHDVESLRHVCSVDTRTEELIADAINSILR